MPPGDWEDAWDGSTVTGPKAITSTQPYEKQPMWHSKAGGLTVMTNSPGLRIGDGDWSTLTLESFHAQTALGTERSVYALQTEARTDLTMRTDGEGAWVVRLHLEPEQRALSVTIDGEEMSLETTVKHLALLSIEATLRAHFPFGGAGAHPPANAGHIAKLRMSSTMHACPLAAGRHRHGVHVEQQKSYSRVHAENTKTLPAMLPTPGCQGRV